MRNENWNRNELIVAFNLYCKITFSKINNKYPAVIELASIINRTPSSVSYKLANFARLDPTLQKRNIKGMRHGSKGEEEIWNKFYKDWERLAFESEKILAEYKKQPVEISANIDISDIPKEGIERERIVKARVNQNFFRSTILASYNNKCCITGLSIPSLLVASHIIPWAKDEKNRMNPQNGLCMNNLHDRAFDNGLITIGEDFRIQLSNVIKNKNKEEIVQKFFLPYENQKIILPQRFLPHIDFLKYHFDYIYIKD